MKRVRPRTGGHAHDSTRALGLGDHGHALGIDLGDRIADAREIRDLVPAQPQSPRGLGATFDQVSCGAYPAPATAVPRLVWLRAAPAGQPLCAVGAASAVGTAWPLAGAAGGAPEAAARKVAVSFQIFRPLTAGRGSTGIDTPHAAGATASDFLARLEQAQPL